MPQPAPGSGACLNPHGIPLAPPRPPSHTCWPGAPGLPWSGLWAAAPAGPSAPATDREAPHRFPARGDVSRALSRLGVGILRLHPHIRRQRGDPHPSRPAHPQSCLPQSRLLSRDTALLHSLTPRNPAPPAAPPATPRGSPTLSFRSSARSPPAAAPADPRAGARGLGGGEEHCPSCHCPRGRPGTRLVTRGVPV